MQDEQIASDSSSEEDEQEEEVEDFPEQDNLFDGHAQLIVGTAFDAYFLQSLPAPKTSSNVFSTLIQPLTNEEYMTALSKSSKDCIPLDWAESCHRPSFSRFVRELHEGFNLLFYGMGSKRKILNTFASEICSKLGHVIIANAFQPAFTLREMLGSIERIPGILDLPLPAGGIEKQTRRIYDFFSQTQSKYSLYLVIHNIDAPVFRSPKNRACLSLLALNSHIHLIASIDKINAPLLWSSSELSTRKTEHYQNLAHVPTKRGYAWLWHDLTTLHPYDVELAHADRSSISGVSTLHGSAARHQQEAASGGQTVAMTETAAQHILASVTQKAKRLFALIAAKQLESMDEASTTLDRTPTTNTTTTATNVNAQAYSILYDTLFKNARDNFIATNDTAFRSLLGEFRDHGLVLSAAAAAVGSTGAGGGGESLWIPLRKERLMKVLSGLEGEV